MFKSKTNNKEIYKHKITQVCHFLDIVLEHANYNVYQIKYNAWAYITKCVKVIYKCCSTMQGHIWMPCVCVPSLVREMRSYIPFGTNEAHFSLKPATCLSYGQAFLWRLESSILRPLNITITREHRFWNIYI